MKQVTILSGLPGCGKTTAARALKALKGDKVVVSADDYFMVKGRYQFDGRQLPQAHDACLARYLAAVQDDDVGLVVVDNTNTTVVEIAPYHRVATALGHEVEIIRFHIDPFLAWERNVHDVPLRTIVDMHARLLTDVLPPYWKVTHRRADPGD